jgi:hypothetical protein
MTLDPDVKNVGKEALVTVTKALEMFVAYIGLKSSQSGISISISF